MKADVAAALVRSQGYVVIPDIVSRGDSRALI